MPVKPFSAVDCAVREPLPPTATVFAEGVAPIRKSAAPDVASGPVTLTLSKTAVFSLVLFCEVTARPAYTVPLSPTDTVLPICCHVAPSDETYPVRLPLARTTRTHTGYVAA